MEIGVFLLSVFKSLGTSLAGQYVKAFWRWLRGPLRRIRELHARYNALVSENAALIERNTALVHDNELGHHIPGFENYQKCIDGYGNVFLEDFKTVRKSGAEPTRACILCAQE